MPTSSSARSSAHSGATAGSLPRLLATAGQSGQAAHLRQWGPRPRGGRSLIQELERSGLVGRGGAGFPTAVKLAAVASARGGVVVANGTEGEPASIKDKSLLTHCPHLVLDGMGLAAEAVGASEAILCVDDRARTVMSTVSHALSERISFGTDSVPIRIEAIPPGYVTGEESALVSRLNGGPSRPASGPRPYQRGVAKKPTLVNNVETFAHIALIARFGAEWFRSVGTPDSAGSALVTICGDVSRPSVYEIALGTSMVEILRPAGPTSRVVAGLVGGYAGTWVRASDLVGLSMDGSSLARVGASIGCGSIVLVGEKSCGLKAAAAITRWLAEQSAGQCGPCANGLPAIADAMDLLVKGHNSARWVEQIERWLWMVEGRGACKHPDGTARMVRSALDVFGNEIARHATHGSCPLRMPAVTPHSRAGSAS